MFSRTLFFAVGAAMLLRAQAPMPFDAASLKPNNSIGGGRASGGGAVRMNLDKVSATNTTVRRMIEAAYHLTSFQLLGGPDWLDSARFDLEAKAASAASVAQLRQMLQTLLADRCKLTLRHESKEMPVWVLAIGKNGLKLPEWKPGEPMPKAVERRPGEPFAGGVTVRGNMEVLTDFLAADPSIGRPVIDKTGLRGTYIINMAMYQDEDFIGAVEEVTGLKFESQKAPLDVLVVEHAEKPSGN